MKVLIIEDELPAAKRISQLVVKHRPDAQILEIIDSVESAVHWLNTFPPPDLIFMDIQLADGLSFDIFTQTEIKSPVIFTTAYDQYTLKAFKFNSVDYLLKPIDEEDLELALRQFEKFHQQGKSFDQNAIQQLLDAVQQKEYKERFLVKIGQQLSYVTTEDIAYFYSEDGLVHAKNNVGKKHILDYTLDQLEGLINPKEFFRINRKLITRLESISKISTWFNSRLKLDLRPRIEFDVIVSRERVSDFKKWLDK